jgi:sugar (pentulose or hexulose) kinase
VSSGGCLLSWDAGSGSCRCLVVDGEGRQQALERDDLPVVRDEGVPAGQEFDPQATWETFVRLTRKALAEVPPEEIAAVSTTSFRDGVVFLDGEGKALYAGTNRDARSVAQGFQMAQRHGEAIYGIAGRWPLGTDAAAHLLWMREFRPELYARIQRMLMVSDWLTYRLCGVHCSEPSNASSSLLFDVNKRRWSPEIADLLELSPTIFPPLRSPGEVVGQLRPQVAEALGLSVQTPVVEGLADSQAACLACGAVHDGDTVAVAGSTMPLQMTLDEPLMDGGHRTWTGAHALDGLWSLEGSAGLAGLAYDWLGQAFCGELSSEEAYALLNAEAEREAPGSALAFMGPWIADHGRLQFPPRVGFLAPFPMTFEAPLTRGKMARAILENIAFAVRGNLEQLMEISGREVETLAVCGGLSRSRLFTQVVADACQLPVRVPVNRETSALGAVMCAAVGAGLYGDLRVAARRMSRGEEVVEPDPAKRTTYRSLYKRWLKTYRSLLGR